MNHENLHLAATLGQLLSAAQARVAVAESCTGGGVGAAITAVPGCSTWFDGGFITYSNSAKQRWLQVGADLLAQYGAVSEEVTGAMAAGVLAQSDADYSVAVSGIAGPDGGSPAKPVGTVWLAWATRSGQTRQQCFHFAGDRESIRDQAVAQALQGLIPLVQSALDAKAV